MWQDGQGDDWFWSSCVEVNFLILIAAEGGSSRTGWNRKEDNQVVATRLVNVFEVIAAWNEVEQRVFTAYLRFFK